MVAGYTDPAKAWEFVQKGQDFVHQVAVNESEPKRAQMKKACGPDFLGEEVDWISHGVRPHIRCALLGTKWMHKSELRTLLK